MSRMKLPPLPSFRQSFSPDGTEAGVDAYMAECRRLVLSADPSTGKLSEAEIVQTTVSLALQRILHWADRHRTDSADPDDIPTHAILGAMTAVGIGAALFSYSGADVAATCGEVIRRAWRNTVDYERDLQAAKKGPWDA
jgi:hypothetical protein